MADGKFISCGMYTLTSELRLAWQALFAAFNKVFPQTKAVHLPIRFASDIKLLRDPDMFIGQTCGYPLMHFLQSDVEPLCAASYQMPGCNGIYYSSQFIVPANSDLHSLADCNGRIVAINSWDSNSGMNVLRYALAPLAQGKAFFSAIRETGSHYQSLVDVTKSKAQLASIDCVSLALINDQWPELVARVRSIGFSIQSCGLPFVVAKGAFSRSTADRIIASLNSALEALDEQSRSCLRIDAFEAVSIADCQSILSLEDHAQKLGYAEIK